MDFFFNHNSDGKADRSVMTHGSLLGQQSQAYHKSGGWKTTGIHSCMVLEVRSLEQRRQQGWLLLVVLRGHSVSCPSPAFCSC